MDDAPGWDRPVFAVGSRQLTIRDVLRAAHFRGELNTAWAEICRQAAAAEESDAEVDADAVQASSEQFRSGRDLISAEETEQWLEQRGLTLEEFGDYFSRLQRRETGGDAASSLSYEEANDGLRDLLRIDLLIGGEFDRQAERLAWRFVAREADASTPPADWLEEMRALEAAYEAQCALLLTEHARQDALVSLRLPLTRVELEVLEVESIDAAHEALLCLREDGESMAEVARDGSYPLNRREIAVEDLPGEIQSPLLSASLGEVLGPFAREDEFQILRLGRKLEPDLADAAIRLRVDQLILERHFSELESKHVRWIIAPSRSYAPAS